MLQQRLQKMASLLRRNPRQASLTRDILQREVKLFGFMKKRFNFVVVRLTAKPRYLLLLHRGKEKSNTVTALISNQKQAARKWRSLVWSFLHSNLIFMTVKDTRNHSTFNFFFYILIYYGFWHCSNDIWGWKCRHCQESVSAKLNFPIQK